MASTYLTRTPSSASNRKTWTWSGWIKKSNTTDKQQIFGVEGGSDNTTWSRLLFLASEKLSFEAYNDTIITNRLFRDASAWYHIVFAVDTTQSTASDRVKLYVNGVQETSFSEATYPSQNQNFGINNTVVHNIGRADGSNAFDGYMSHVSFVDGQQLAPTVFGETDSTSGIWKFKSPSGVTWGTNGFHLKFENSGNLGLDSSGNSNTFTVNGNGRQALDTPSNVYATLNANNNYYPSMTLSNGNTSLSQPGAKYAPTGTTLGMTSGKWYAEMKCTAVSQWGEVGIFGQFATSATMNIGSLSDGYSYMGGSSATGTNQKMNNDSRTAYDTAFTTNDIVSVAVDLDNNKLHFGKNGTWLNSGDPTSGSTGTGAAFTLGTPSSGAYFFASDNWDGSNSFSSSWNFGNGYFGTTAITSAGSNGNGSLFEYDVPSGYYALNTKNINTYG